MIFLGGLVGLIALAVWIFCVIDVITTPADQVRSLPKLVWVAVVVLFVEFGAVAWLVAGRPWNARAMTPGAARSGAGVGGAMSAGTAQRRRPARPTNPDDDDEFLAGLAKQQRDRDAERGDDGPAQPA